MAHTNNPIHIIGGGLAGSEAAWQLASAGVPVVLHEMRPVRGTEAHQTDGLAELVCSNSFRSDDAANNAVGLLHEEMRRCGSLIMRAADATSCRPAARWRSTATASPPRSRRRWRRIRWSDRARGDRGPAAGRLGQRDRRHRPPHLAGARRGDPRAHRRGALAFFDAIAPIVHRDSIDMAIAWRQSRYDRTATAPTTSTARWTRRNTRPSSPPLLAGDKTEFKDWEKNTPYFDGCLPIEVMAERGPETLRFGPMKPVGLTNPRTGRRAYAVVQLRQDNALGTLYNIVGFQTKLKHGEQTRIFRTIPGLEQRRVRAAGRPAPQHLPQQPAAAGRALCA